MLPAFLKFPYEMAEQIRITYLRKAHLTGANDFVAPKGEVRGPSPWLCNMS